MKCMCKDLYSKAQKAEPLPDILRTKSINESLRLFFCDTRTHTMWRVFLSVKRPSFITAQALKSKSNQLPLNAPQD